MKIKIKSLTIMNYQFYEVGMDNVTTIENKSSEFEDKIDFVFLIYKNHILWKEVINCSVVIEYFENTDVDLEKPL